MFLGRSMVRKCHGRQKRINDPNVGSSNIMGPWVFQGIHSKNQTANPGHSYGGSIWRVSKAMLYCDRFRNLLKNTPRVKCLVDSGYFIHAKNPQQAIGFENIYNALITLHVQTTVDRNLNDNIESRTLNESQKMALREFRSEFLNALPKPNNPELRGVFIDSLNHHTSLQKRWSPENAVVINNLGGVDRNEHGLVGTRIALNSCFSSLANFPSGHCGGRVAMSTALNFICDGPRITMEYIHPTLSHASSGESTRNHIFAHASSSDSTLVCLDGSPPAYHFEPGFGDGVENWIVHLSGGAWCVNVTDCQKRINDPNVGSSNIMGPWVFQGIHSKNQTANPDFYNWNKVFVRYCDGGSFTGDVEYVDPATNLHFRGARIYEAVLEELLAKGLRNAKNAILTGGSAGGYPAMLYCDRFRNLLKNTPRVKCLVDSGYFIHAKNPQQAIGFENIYNALITLHVQTTVDRNLNDNIESRTLNESQKMALRVCLDGSPPAYHFEPGFGDGVENWIVHLSAILIGGSVEGIQAMLYCDRFRNLLKNTPRVKCLVDSGYFIHAKNPQQAIGFENIYNALITLHVQTTVDRNLNDNIESRTLNESQKMALREFRSEFLNALPKPNNPELRGVFIDSLNHHTSLQKRWSPENAVVINNLSAPKAFADWYFDRKHWYVIDQHDVALPKFGS
ncbi:hypothetical protein RND71_019171 [Anisodus tanguticus]|uniref:Pectin acetylesterase n=1 Tax=Anisodus tanguticus TaxID=243964 RepID=A0AAE1VG78_9SOLA|nr:hypothetical protein RND71_019171 [Anisodus tanguticus]